MSATTVLNSMAEIDRHIFIIHAIRHLLNHAPDRVAFGDVAAIDILQDALDGPDAIFSECPDCDQGAVTANGIDFNSCSRCRGTGRL